MPRKGRYGYFHERKERQFRQYRVQFVVTFDVKYTDVRIQARNSPQVPPLAHALKFLRLSLLVGFQSFKPLLIEIEGRTNVHANMIEHGSLAPCKSAHFFVVEDDTQTGCVGNMDMKVLEA